MGNLSFVASATGLLLLLASPAGAQSCGSLEGLEEAILASTATPQALLVSSMNRLGYGVNPKSWLNTKTVARLQGTPELRRRLATILAKQIRSGFANASRVHAPSLAATEDLYPLSYSLDMTGRYLTFVEIAATTPPEEFQAAKYAHSLVSAMQARKRLAALDVSDYNVGEVLDDFWFNHFNTNGPGVPLYAQDYEMALRSKLCGTFGDLLLASARHPAMLAYLNNIQNSKRILNRQGAVVADVNENYGREVIELHTLGTGPIRGFDANGKPIYAYSQDEVFESARVLTGWHFHGPNSHNASQVEFFFNAARNDEGTKVFPLLMRDVRGPHAQYGAGEAEAERFLRDLARHPLTKTNICRKLGNYLFGGNVPPNLVGRCVAAWGEQGDLPKMYASFVASKEFWSTQYMFLGFKTPHEAVSSADRALGLSGRPDLTANLAYLSGVSRYESQMGLNLFSYVFPTGYKIGLGAWNSSAYLDGSMHESFRAVPYLAVSHQGLDGDALETWVSNLRADFSGLFQHAGDGLTFRPKEEVQVETSLEQVVPAFPDLRGTRLRVNLQKELREGKADRVNGKPAPLRTVVTQAVSSALFLRK